MITVFFFNDYSRHGLTVAIIHGIIDVIQFYLHDDTTHHLEHMPDSNGHLPIHFAVMFSTIDIVQILFENHYDINIIYDNGQTPLNYAISVQNNEMYSRVRFLQ